MGLVISVDFLESIEKNMFSRLNELTVLDLSNNRLNKLNANSFYGLENLISLNMKQNNLANFDLRILNNIRKIEQIDLSENTIVNREEILFEFSEKLWILKPSKLHPILNRALKHMTAVFLFCHQFL